MDEDAADNEPLQSSHDYRGRSGALLANVDVFWPRDLLPNDFEDVRIMTFGYSSSPASPGKDNLYTLSNDLLQKLANKRMDEVSLSYMLMFSAQSDHMFP